MPAELSPYNQGTQQGTSNSNALRAASELIHFWKTNWNLRRLDTTNQQSPDLLQSQWLRL